jgi:hypothetical protein
MKTPHKHAELIKAWADGAEIQLKLNAVQWGDCVDPYWNPDLEYRIKPEPKPDVVRWCWATGRMGEREDHFGENGSANLKITFDGETGKLKSAEVLQ